MVVDAIGAFLNILLIIAFLADPLKVLRRGVWITILNLAFADLISCVANFFDVGLISEFDVTDSMTFRIVRFFLTFGVSASFMLLATLTVETYVVTKYPIKGRVLLTRKKTVILCAMAWFLAMPLGLSNIAYLFTDNFSRLMKIYIAQIAVLELTVIVQVILKVLIIREIMKSRRNTHQQQQRQNNKHKEIAKSIIILNVILIVTALPYLVSKQLEFIWKLRVVGEDQLLWRFSNYYEPIAAINYLANPILYALRLPDYRRTLLAPFTKCKSLSFTGCLRWNNSIITARTEISKVQQSTTTRL
ncbi:5-hydroxytryptamine receptor 2A-like [Paramuricea clavata]|uniref:5-hydroxytryptamine receptor 2A-like n=1 Tax=Paramuricea clavata TaxID=317549 RepID=A0A7D9DQQ0_PARCT|nr:5-hydroxytryptamine receptor 2A-like [Paramuricea clavata]